MNPKLWPRNLTTCQFNDRKFDNLKTQRPQNLITPKLGDPETCQLPNLITPKLNNPKYQQPQNSMTLKFNDPKTPQTQVLGESE